MNFTTGFLKYVFLKTLCIPPCVFEKNMTPFLEFFFAEIVNKYLVLNRKTVYFVNKVHYRKKKE